jgi:hypothetical protein
MGKKRVSIAVIVIATVIVGMGAWLVARDNSDIGDQAVSGSSITYLDSGFSPKVLRTASGTKIVLENDSSKEVHISSRPHPTHTANPELNGDVLAPGERQTLLLTNKGNWQYHNHLDPDQGGTVIVE